MYTQSKAEVKDLQTEAIEYQNGEFDRFEIRRFHPN